MSENAAEIAKLTAEAAAHRTVTHVLVGILVIAGIVLVFLAEPLGQLSVQQWDSRNGFIPEEAHTAATSFRTLGVMAFFAAMVERTLLVFRDR